MHSQAGHCLEYPLRTRRALSLNFDLHLEQRIWTDSSVPISATNTFVVLAIEYGRNPAESLSATEDSAGRRLGFQNAVVGW